MKVLKWLLVLVVVAAVAIAGFMGYLGMFSKVNVTEQKMGPYKYAYVEFTGPYEKSMPAFDEVNNALTAEGIVSSLGIGVYFDDPKSVAADKLRSHCGSIIETKDYAKLAKLKGKVKTGVFKETNCIVAEFPIKNPLSFMVGPMKVYPAMSKYMLEKGYKGAAGYELYDMPNKITYYFMPIVK